MSAVREEVVRKVKPEDCPKLDECYKVKMILDKDLLDFQYTETIRAVCANCLEVKGGEVIELKKAKGRVSSG